MFKITNMSCFLLLLLLLLFCMFFSVRYRGRNRPRREGGGTACALAHVLSCVDVCVLCSVVQQRGFFRILSLSACVSLCSAFSAPTTSISSLTLLSIANRTSELRAQSVDTRRNSKFYSVHLKFFIGNVHTHLSWVE